MHVVPYPVRESEFEIQAELYALLKPICDVRGCVQARCHEGKKCPKVFFDLVVFTPDKQAVLIVECKNTPNNKSFSLPFNSRQDRRYCQFGVPVIRCGSREQFDHILNFVEAEMERWLTAQQEVGTGGSELGRI